MSVSTSISFVPRCVVTEVANEDGFRFVLAADPPDRAESLGIVPDIAFVRKDGWSLGAMWEDSLPASMLWKDEYVNEVVLDESFAFVIAVEVPWRLEGIDTSEYALYINDKFGHWTWHCHRYALQYRSLVDALIALDELECAGVDCYGMRPFVALARVR